MFNQTVHPKQHPHASLSFWRRWCRQCIVFAMLAVCTFQGKALPGRDLPAFDAHRVLSDTTFVQDSICDFLLPYIWNGVTFTQAGTQTAVLTASDGSDSVVVMTLVVGTPTYLSVFGNACEGENYTEHGFNLPSDSVHGGPTRVYVRTSPNGTGCDSIITLTLSINPLPTIHSSGDTILDPGQSVALSASGADYYVWAPASNLSSTITNNTVCTPDHSMYVFVSGYNTGINLIGNGDFE